MDSRLTTVKISGLVEWLDGILAEHGDLPLWYMDGDCDSEFCEHALEASDGPEYLMRIEERTDLHLDCLGETIEKRPKRLVIQT